MDRPPPDWLPAALETLFARRPLAPGVVRAAVAAMIAGELGEAETAAFLVALRAKGETGEELAAAAGVLRERMTRLAVPAGLEVLDTCGTGGDGAGTFNISTATAFVAAACGVPVVKHGNRAVSSNSGSSDVLAALGLPVEAGPAWAAACLRDAGLGFGFAPHFHPALARVAPVRRRLRVRTLFNLVGPLANPAGAAYQLLGVGRPELLDPVADAAARLGTRRAVVVGGGDGLDEVTLAGPTRYRLVEAGRVAAGEWVPGDFGLPEVPTAALAADGPAASAEVIRGVLDPSAADGPARLVVLANAAAALVAAGRAATPAEGVAAARRAVASGAAAGILDKLRRVPPGGSGP